MTTSEEIQKGVDAALAKLEGHATPRQGAAPKPFRVSSDRIDSYTRRALQDECDSIAGAPDGDQNNTINRAAFNVGTLVGAGALDETEAREMLMSAALAGNHPEGRARPSIDSGLRAGIGSPRHPWPPVSRQDDAGVIRDLVADAENIDWSDLESDFNEPADEDADLPDGGPTPLAGLIPAEVYEARAELRHIRQAGHSRTRSGDVALLATITRLSSAGLAPHPRGHRHRRVRLAEPVRRRSSARPASASPRESRSPTDSCPHPGTRLP
jgi:hypothetical protein